MNELGALYDSKPRIILAILNEKRKYSIFEGNYFQYLYRDYRLIIRTDLAKMRCFKTMRHRTKWLFNSRKNIFRSFRRSDLISNNWHRHIIVNCEENAREDLSSPGVMPKVEGVFTPVDCCIGEDHNPRNIEQER